MSSIKKFSYFVNGRQTRKERRYKYRYLRKHGIHWEKARRMRDWTMFHIKTFLEYNVDNNVQ